MMKKLFLKVTQTNKQYFILFISVFFLNTSINAQIPTDHLFSYLFTDGSTDNSTLDSAVSSLSNSFISIADRNNVAGNAAETDSVMSASLSTALPNNTLTTSLSFWIRSDNEISSQRILQMYGSNGNGFRVNIAGSRISIHSKIATTSGGASTQGSFSCTTDLVAGKWHHIVFKTVPNSTSTVLNFYVYIDGVEQSFELVNGDSMNTPSIFTEYVKAANFVINPLSEFTGDLDDIYFYTKSLSDAEVTQLYNDCSSLTVAVTNNEGTLTATSSSTDYQWNKDGVAISGATDSTYVTSEGGDYTCVVSENICTTTSNTISIEKATSIKEASFENLNIYPNPTNGMINLNVSESLSAIKIMDLAGKTIKVFNATQTQLDISAFTAGIYFLEIANAERKSVVKIIKR